jgi:hypothetical protein
MFTVKLYQNQSLKLVQSKKISIYKDKPDAIIELVTDEESFFIKDVFQKAPDKIDYYDCAYIENERGSTTQRVTPNMVLA